MIDVTRNMSPGRDRMRPFSAVDLKLLRRHLTTSPSANDDITNVRSVRSSYTSYWLLHFPQEHARYPQKQIQSHQGPIVWLSLFDSPTHQMHFHISGSFILLRLTLIALRLLACPSFIALA